MSDSEKAKEDSIIEKIRKLLDKANSTGYTEAEAQTFMLHAQKLLQQYNLDMSQITSKTTEAGIQEDNIPYTETWEGSLLYVIADNNFCRTIRGDVLYLIGSKDNVIVVSYLFSFYRNKVMQLCIAAYSRLMAPKKEMFGMGFDMPKRDRMNWMRDYYDGCVTGIYHKLLEQKRHAAASSSQLAGIILTKSTEIDLYVSFRFPNLSKGRASKKKRGAGYDAGYSDGRNISPVSGVNSTSAKAHIS